METLMHMYPCFALARSGELGLLGPRLTAAAVFLTLNLMLLKFLLLWRIARAWALLDGIDPPENMRRAKVRVFFEWLLAEAGRDAAHRALA